MEVFATNLYSILYHGSEFIALKFVGKEAEWQTNLLEDVPLWGRQASLVSHHCDSQEIVCTMEKEIYSHHTWYSYSIVERRCYFLGICNVLKKFSRSRDQGLYKEIKPWNIVGDWTESY